MEASYIHVQTTAPTREEADRIVSALVDRGLAACVQVLGPIASTYRWQGAIERAEEWLCLVKTERRLFGSLADAIRAAHSYDTPEIVATEIVEGSAAYLQWIGESLRQDDAPQPARANDHRRLLTSSAKHTPTAAPAMSAARSPAVTSRPGT